MIGTTKVCECNGDKFIRNVALDPTFHVRIDVEKPVPVDQHLQLKSCARKRLHKRSNSAQQHFMLAESLDVPPKSRKTLPLFMDEKNPSACQIENSRLDHSLKIKKHKQGFPASVIILAKPAPALRKVPRICIDCKSNKKNELDPRLDSERYLRILSSRCLRCYYPIKADGSRRCTQTTSNSFVSSTGLSCCNDLNSRSSMTFLHDTDYRSNRCVSLIKPNEVAATKNDLNQSKVQKASSSALKSCSKRSAISSGTHMPCVSNKDPRIRCRTQHLKSPISGSSEKASVDVHKARQHELIWQLIKSPRKCKSTSASRSQKTAATRSRPKHKPLPALSKGKSPISTRKHVQSFRKRTNSFNLPKTKTAKKLRFNIEDAMIPSNSSTTLNFTSKKSVERASQASVALTIEQENAEITNEKQSIIPSCKTQDNESSIIVKHEDLSTSESKCLDRSISQTQNSNVSINDVSFQKSNLFKSSPTVKLSVDDDNNETQSQASDFSANAIGFIPIDQSAPSSSNHTKCISSDSGNSELAKTPTIKVSKMLIPSCDSVADLTNISSKRGQVASSIHGLQNDTSKLHRSFELANAESPTKDFGAFDLSSNALMTDSIQVNNKSVSGAGLDSSTFLDSKCVQFSTKQSLDRLKPSNSPELPSQEFLSNFRNDEIVHPSTSRETRFSLDAETNDVGCCSEDSCNGLSLNYFEDDIPTLNVKPKRKCFNRVFPIALSNPKDSDIAKQLICGRDHENSTLLPELRTSLSSVEQPLDSLQDLNEKAPLTNILETIPTANAGLEVPKSNTIILNALAAEKNSQDIAFSKTLSLESTGCIDLSATPLPKSINLQPKVMLIDAIKTGQILKDKVCRFTENPLASLSFSESTLASNPPDSSDKHSVEVTKSSVLPIDILSNDNLNQNVPASGHIRQEFFNLSQLTPPRSPWVSEYSFTYKGSSYYWPGPSPSVEEIKGMSEDESDTDETLKDVRVILTRLEESGAWISKCFIQVSLG